MSEKGYVYILTNPSFKENWVKIGQTSRSVEERIASLDNTSIPLPFEVFATMKTCYYVKAERLIHNMIDLLATQKRVRKGREFFNIEPEMALEIFEDVAEVIEDAEIKVAEKEHTGNGSDAANARDVSSTRAMLVEFWNGFKEYVNDNAQHLMRLVTQKSRANNCYDIHIGLHNCHVVVGVSVMHKWIKIGVWAYHDQELIDKFVGAKDALEKAVGGEFEVGGNKALSMYTYQDFDVIAKDKWNEAFAWYVGKFPLLRDAMQQIVRK